ncbi:MAG TPA: AAA family ATPase [Segetibacter sp.]|jgi:predicted kinase
MEAIIFCGIQASGKTTFYQEKFFKTHIRISLDLLNTRGKENKFLQTCFETQQRFVIDNTNATKKERQKYIEAAKQFKFKLICYYFHATLGEAKTRNKNRIGKEHVPAAGIGGTFKKLQVPLYDEGFDEINIVEIAESEFKITLLEKEQRDHL